MRRYNVSVGGKRYELDVAEQGGDRFEVHLDGRVLEVRLEEAEAALAASHPAPEHGRTQTISAPLPGVVTAVEVAPGKRVARGDVLVTLEAMKMVNPIRAPGDGVVGEVRVAAGQSVGHGDVLLTLVG